MKMILAASLAAAISGPALAQDAAPVGEAQCELHVWPAERFQSMSTSLLGGGLLDAAIHADKDKDNKSKLASALDPQGQLDALASLDLPRLMNAQSVRVITHIDPLDRKTLNKISTRRATSTSPCYSELIVTDLVYTAHPIYGRSMTTAFMWREFTNAASKPASVGGAGSNRLSLFPPKEGEDFQAASDELTTVFKANFEEFARKVAKRAAGRK